MTEGMNVKDYDYDLPEELIAQDPLEDRSSSRLMVLDRQTGDVEHRHFTDILEYLHPGDCLVINNTKVIPARLFGVKEDTQAKIEVLLLKRKENDIWETLVKPGKKAKPGTKLVFGDGLLTAEVVDVVEEGNRLIQFHYDGIFEEILDQLGQMPLPPYITHQLKDKNRYQTVYAKYDGSAAAGIICSGSKYCVIKEVLPSRCSPAAASTIPSSCSSCIFFILVSTFPRIPVMRRSFRSCRS